MLILRRELLAGLDPERRIRRQDAIGIHVRVREIEGIFGNDAAGELERCGIQREALDDVQFAAVGSEPARLPGAKPTVSTTSVLPSQRPIKR